MTMKEHSRNCAPPKLFSSLIGGDKDLNGVAFYTDTAEYTGRSPAWIALSV